MSTASPWTPGLAEAAAAAAPAGALLGATLPVHRWGSGPLRLVWLHGFLGDRHAFDHLEALLGRLVTAHCVELPGHGAAAPPAREGPDGFQGVVDALAALLPDDGRTVLAGYSQGARLALALALAAPAKVRRLILESGTAGIDDTRRRRRRRELDLTRAAALHASGLEAFVDAWERLPLLAGLGRLDEHQRAALRRRRLAHDAAGVAAALRAYGQGAQPSLWGALPSLRVPTLLVTGTEDLRYGGLARRLRDALPLAWHVAVPGAGHTPHLEQPAAFAQALEGFLTREGTHRVASPAR